ncbi:MAG: peptidoglycan editing factor PgeF [Halothiobacillaceae bacterium]|nr:peptidoglycan editing factor PgeF [Halothiobacillaceae bacterium]
MSEAGGQGLLWPDWPAPAPVRAVVTTRHGGVSAAPWTTLNLATHVGDDPQAVAENRRRLRAALSLPAEPFWLEQVHGIRVAEPGKVSSSREADAAYADRPGVVCAVLTADCLPVLFCDETGHEVAVAHAGWRGLAGGVLEASIARFNAPPERLLAWLGPAIGPGAFEVGDDVREAFLCVDGGGTAFVPAREGRWMADLFALARLRLAQAGVARVFGGGLCTHADAGRFYSYRRDGVTGRMASLIWLEG